MFYLCTFLTPDLYKCLHETAPSYLAEMCHPVAASTGRRNLRPSTHGDLLVPRTRTITYGPRSFAVSGPCVWNDLPSTTPSASPGTLSQFQSTLKTTLFLFSLRDMIWRSRDRYAVRITQYKFTYLFTYLLTLIFQTAEQHPIKSISEDVWCSAKPLKQLRYFACLSSGGVA